MDSPELAGHVRWPSDEGLSEVTNPNTGETSFLPRRHDGRIHTSLRAVLRHPELQCRSTALTYGRLILRFDTFAERHCGVLWDAPPAEVCEAYLAYLKVRGATVRHKNRKFHVSIDPCDPKALKPSTLLVGHEAIKTFYRLARKLNLYRHKDHPLYQVDVSEFQKVRDIVDMDDPSGKGHRPYHPRSIHRYINTTWVLQPLLGEELFSDMLRDAFDREGVGRRDRAIMELMLTGGPRLSEAAEATLEGWAVLDEHGRAFHGRIYLRNKGDGEAPSKVVYVIPRTAALMRQYFMEDRPNHDPLADAYRAWAAGRGVTPDFSPESYLHFIRMTREAQGTGGTDALPARTPIFLTRTGRPYNDDGFRQVAWRPALKAAEPPIEARPHQMRHWFVTFTLVGIAIKYSGDQLKMMAARKQLGTYMHWKWPEQMLGVYDQSLQDQFRENPASAMAQYAEERLRPHAGNVQAMLRTLTSGSAETQTRLEESAALFAEIRAARETE